MKLKTYIENSCSQKVILYEGLFLLCCFKSKKNPIVLSHLTFLTKNDHGTHFFGIYWSIAVIQLMFLIETWLDGSDLLFHP